MTADDYEKLIVERNEFVLVNYFKQLDIYSFRLVTFSPLFNVQNENQIESAKKCFNHENYDFFPQFDGDFVYIVNRNEISLPLTPLMLHIANQSAKDQKEIRLYQKKKAEENRE